MYSDFIVLAGRVNPNIYTHLSLRSPAKERRNILIKTSYQRHRLHDAAHDVKLKGDDVTTALSEAANKFEHLALPGHTQGFLYLHQPPPESGQPRAASSIRFRCTPSLAKIPSSYAASLKLVKKSTLRSEPTHSLPPLITNAEIYGAFKAGYDLTLLSGIPWGISVVYVAARTSLKFIRLQLLEDKIFSESEMREYKNIYKNTSHTRGSNLLYTLNDVFLVRFDKKIV